MPKSEKPVDVEGFVSKMEAATAAKRDWTAYTKGLLRAEMARRQITYKGLVEKLSDIGIEEKEENLRNKISRGGFTASFFVQCLKAIGCTNLRLDD